MKSVWHILGHFDEHALLTSKFIPLKNENSAEFVDINTKHPNFHTESVR